MKLAVLLHDARRLWRAARAHPRQRRAARRMDLGLAFLDAAPGQDGITCEAAVTELGPAPREVELTFDMWADDGPGAGGGPGGRSEPVGHVVLRAVTVPRRRTPVRLHSDFCGGHHRRPATLFLVLRHQGQEVDRIEMRLPDGRNSGLPGHGQMQPPAESA